MVLRLDTLCPGLQKKLRLASANKRRSATIAAVEMAVAQSKIAHRLVDEGLQSLRTGAIVTPQQTAELEALTTILDDRYFDLYEAVEAGQSPDEDYTRVFAQARAVASLTFAGGANSLQAASEAIYEAAAAVSDDRQLFAIVNSKA